MTLTGEPTLLGAEIRSDELEVLRHSIDDDGHQADDDRAAP